MPLKKPIIQGSVATFEQLKRTDDLDIPLNERVSTLEQQMRDLAEMLLVQGIEIPESLTEGL